MTTIRRQRELPLPGMITVGFNERVQPQDIVAEVELARKHEFIDIARGLGVPAVEASRYLTKEKGDRVEKGEIIAGPAGISRRTIRAPSEGRIAGMMEGRLLFEVRQEPFILHAGFPGEIVGTDGSMNVTIETSGALIQGVWGNGKQDLGVMRIVGKGPRDRLLTDQLDVELRGAVLVAGICEHPAPLNQARELSVRGIILGGLSAELVPIAKGLPYPVIVLDGFGSAPMNRAAYELLTTNRGRDAALDAQPADPYSSHRPEVIIPLPVVSPTDIPEDLIPLAPGVRVRVLRDPYRSEVGVVEEILDQVVSYPSGVLCKSARVNLEVAGRTTVPLANLDILT